MGVGLYSNSNSKSDMSCSQTVEVATFGSVDPVAIVLPQDATARQAKAALGAKLGVKADSMKLFQLHLGPIGRPRKVFKDEDALPMAPLSLQRWHFDLKEESSISKQDDTAIHLLYSEAKFHLESGKINPSADQLHELDSLSDPLFPTEQQFLELVRSVPGYTSYMASGCTLVKALECNEGSVPVGSTVSCVLDVKGVSLVADAVRIDWKWNIVRRWKMDSKSFTFEACVHKLNAPLLEWIQMDTKQSAYLFHTASGLCDAQKSPQKVAASNPLLAGKYYDPLAEFVNSALFSAPKFTSLEQT